METSRPANEIQNGRKKEWYKKPLGVIIAILILPIFSIWYVWEKSKLNTSNKWAMTIVIIILSLIIVSASGSSDKNEEATKNQPTQNQSKVQVMKSEAELALEKANKEAERNAKILAQEEAEKKKEEQKKARVQAEEDKRNVQAEKYCDERKNDSTSFTIFEASHIITEDKTRRYSTDGLISKKGPQMATSDCRKIIDFMHAWGIEKIQEISERKYWIGMNGIELTLSAGVPNDINKDNYGGGERAQWVYNKDIYGVNAYYFYIEDNKLTGYQDY
jgi:hypothetical protein